MSFKEKCAKLMNTKGIEKTHIAMGKDGQKLLYEVLYEARRMDNEMDIVFSAIEKFINDGNEDFMTNSDVYNKIEKMREELK